MLSFLAAIALNCGPVPALVLDPNFSWPHSMQEGGADWRRLRANFEAGFMKACNDGVLPSTGPVDRNGRQFNSLRVANNPNANMLMISRASPESGGGMWLEDVFVDPNGKVRIPTANDVAYELMCVMKPPSAEEVERTGDCLYD